MQSNGVPRRRRLTVERVGVEQRHHPAVARVREARDDQPVARRPVDALDRPRVRERRAPAPRLIEHRHERRPPLIMVRGHGDAGRARVRIDMEIGDRPRAGVRPAAEAHAILEGKRPLQDAVGSELQQLSAFGASLDARPRPNPGDEGPRISRNRGGGRPVPFGHQRDRLSARKAVPPSLRPVLTHPHNLFGCHLEAHGLSRPRPPRLPRDRREDDDDERDAGERAPRRLHRGRRAWRRTRGGVRDRRCESVG